MDAMQKRYLKVIDYARERYTVNGVLVLHYENQKESKYSTIERLAFERYCMSII